MGPFRRRETAGRRRWAGDVAAESLILTAQLKPASLKSPALPNWPSGIHYEARENTDPDARPFARKVNETERQGLTEGANLVDVVRQVKPDVFLGLSVVGGLLSKEVLEAVKGSTSTRPSIFAISNPKKNGNTLLTVLEAPWTLLAECTPEEAFSIVGDNIIFGRGSPFSNVHLGNGHVGHCNQENNMFLFPGIGLGTLLSGSKIVSDGMLQASAE